MTVLFCNISNTGKTKLQHGPNMLTHSALTRMRIRIFLQHNIIICVRVIFVLFRSNIVSFCPIVSPVRFIHVYYMNYNKNVDKSCRGKIFCSRIVLRTFVACVCICVSMPISFAPRDSICVRPFLRLHRRVHATKIDFL